MVRKVIRKMKKFIISWIFIFFLAVLPALTVNYALKHFTAKATEVIDCNRTGLDDMLALWQDKLDIQDYLIYIIIEPNQERMQHGETIKENSIIRGDVIQIFKKVAYVRLHTVEEAVLVHELVHVKFPKDTEQEIRKITKQLMEAK